MISSSLSKIDVDLALGRLLVLSEVNGIGSRTLTYLLAKVGSVDGLWTDDPTVLRELLPNRCADPVIEGWRHAIHHANPLAKVEKIRSQGVSILISPKNTWAPDSLTYPELLANTEDPPNIVYVKGNPHALEGKTVGMVGTRRISEYGRQMVNHLVEGLVPVGACIISGLAEGVDGAAHEAALANGLPTVAVFGCGIDKVFPAFHKRLAQRIVAEGGALVSEYPPGMGGTRGTYPQRNRIISGLSYGTVVVEGAIASGSLITARCAMDDGRAVFAVPGHAFSPGSEGPHSLIKDGAILTTSATDILHELHWEPASWPNNGLVDSIDSSESSEIQPSLLALNLTDDQRLVMKALAYEPKPLALLQQHSGLSVDVLQTTLTLLELMGLAKQHPGAQFSRL
ncbi:MAG: DNA-processing protein DprA [Vampirovibrionales bacterium]|nr:DNA-processing protein DprA [Vampirovibrionales bacterium]